MSDDNMRDSGIEWVGEIPAEWDVAKCQYVMMSDKKIAGMRSSEYQRISLTMNGVVPRDKNDRDGLQPRDFDSYQIVRQNQLIFKLIDLANKATSRVGLSPYEGITSPAYIIASCDEGHLTARYAYYYFTDMYFRYVFNGLGNDGVRSSLTKTALMNLKIVLPPLPEQRRIATYLDARVSRIDRLVDGLSRRVELLDEYKKSLISETVTKGIRQHENMKDSGIEWIGEIPTEWDVAKCQYVMMSDKKIAGMRSSEYQRISLTMNGVVPRDKNDRDGLQPRDFDSYQIVRQNQLIFKLIDLANKATSRVGLSPYEGITSPAYIIASCDEGHLTARYAYYYFTDMYFRYVFNGLGNDGVRSSLTKTALMNLKIVLPPLSEQREIAVFLDERVSVINRLMDACRKQIDSLGEYKKSLISECVTGKRRIADADLEGVSVA